MTDEIFISEETGKRYKFMDITFQPGIGYLKEIVEPKLEVGDWLLWAVSESPEPDDRILSRITYGGDFPVNLYHPDLLEVRKANGEIWQKVNNEWRKK